jgi:integrase
MNVGMGLIQDRNKTWIVRRKVPERLREPVSRVLDRAKQQQVWLQRSTRTKNKAEAKRLAPAIMEEFAKVLREAEGLLAERPLRTALAQSEIERIAEFHYASLLAGDDEFSAEGAQAEEDFSRSIAVQFDEAGIECETPAPFDNPRPLYGLTDRQVVKRDVDLKWWLQHTRAALARSDISIMSEHLPELLDRFRLSLDPNSAAYRRLGIAVLRADVRGHEALERRSRGEAIDTPPIAHLEPSTELASRSLRSDQPKGDRLSAAVAGWKKQRDRSSSTASEYERAVGLFTQLHGDMPVANITKQHARTFREALQDIPRSRSKELAQMALPRLIEWRRSHPEVKCLTPGTVNKLLGGVQAVAAWAAKNGIVPDSARWSDPFAEMKLPESDEIGGGPFDPNELRTLFASPVFTAGERPRAGKADVAFWLPLLALFTGARRSELTMRKAGDICKDEVTGHWAIAIYADKVAGQKLKTVGSARTVPVHPELVRLGFIDYVETARKAGTDAWLFPAVSSEKAANAWTHWFGRYLDKLKIAGDGKGLHSLRHQFTDALRRAGGIPEDLNDALTGHVVRTVGRRYGARSRHPTQRHKIIVERYGMAQLVEAVGKVHYPSIDLQAIKSLAATHKGAANTVKQMIAE